jgi:hypothetical protein
MLPDQSQYFRLDLKPDVVVNAGHRYTRKALHEWAPKNVFAERDLYTTIWGDVANTDIERFFFGRLDAEGPRAIEYFSTFEHPSVDRQAFQNLLRYMSVQKLRTPKGLSLLTETAGSPKNLTLLLLQNLHQMFCAIWTECVWQIVDASNSPTKFIVSDHPVTVYNRACPPQSAYCRGAGDPDIRMAATQTIFPLSIDKALLLTNLSWVRNPYQSELKFRPNPEMFRPAIFSFNSIQVKRSLDESEVIMMNAIIKRRAYRYIAAAHEEWLYPEKHIKNDHWRKFGDGYLLMPEPRLIHMGGDIYIGYRDGSRDAFSEYGHKPSQRGFRDARRERIESAALDLFQSEWAMLRGCRYTAENFAFMRSHRFVDDDDDMGRHKENWRKGRRSRA